jgi:predicted phosphodiesterase
MSKVVVVGDTHFPFTNGKALKEVLSIIKIERPTHVVQIGDLLDQYVFSNYSKSAKIAPHREITLGMEEAEKFWKDVQKATPKAKCIQLLGNHDIRLAKRIRERIPELESAFSNLNYKFKGVTTSKSDRDYVVIDGVAYVHGWLSKSIDHAKHFNMPTVHGHRHRPCIEVDRPGLWSMDVGFLGDESYLPFQYTQSKLTKWTLASGIVENGHPRLLFLGGKK